MGIPLYDLPPATPAVPDLTWRFPIGLPLPYDSQSTLPAEPEPQWQRILRYILGAALIVGIFWILVLPILKGIFFSPDYEDYYEEDEEDYEDYEEEEEPEDRSILNPPD